MLKHKLEINAFVNHHLYLIALDNVLALQDKVLTQLEAALHVMLQIAKFVTPQIAKPALNASILL